MTGFAGRRKNNVDGDIVGDEALKVCNGSKQQHHFLMHMHVIFVLSIHVGATVIALRCQPLFPARYARAG